MRRISPGEEITEEEISKGLASKAIVKSDKYDEWDLRLFSSQLELMGLEIIWYKRDGSYYWFVNLVDRENSLKKALFHVAWMVTNVIGAASIGGFIVGLATSDYNTGSIACLVSSVIVLALERRRFHSL